MKLNVCILCMAVIYQGICLVAAEQEEPAVVEPAAQIVRPPSPVFQAPASSDLAFPNKKARIIICTEKQEWGNRVIRTPAKPVA